MRTPTRCGLVGSVLGCVGWACTTAVRAVGGGLVRPGSEHDDTAQAARCWMVFTRVQAGKRGRARAARGGDGRRHGLQGIGSAARRTGTHSQARDERPRYAESPHRKRRARGWGLR